MPDIASLMLRGQACPSPCSARTRPHAQAVAPLGLRGSAAWAAWRSRVFAFALATLALGLMADGAVKAATWNGPASATVVASLPPDLVGYGPDKLKDLTDPAPGAPKEDQQAETPADPIGPPAPIDNWHAFDLAFQSCLQPLEGPSGAELTLKFGLDTKGRLRGKPIASHSRMTGTPAEQRAFVADALANLARCLPLPLTPRFGPIVASRPLILRFLGPRPRERGA